MAKAPQKIQFATPQTNHFADGGMPAGLQPTMAISYADGGSLDQGGKGPWNGDLNANTTTFNQDYLRGANQGNSNAVALMFPPVQQAPAGLTSDMGGAGNASSASGQSGSIGGLASAVGNALGNMAFGPSFGLANAVSQAINGQSVAQNAMDMITGVQGPGVNSATDASALGAVNGSDSMSDSSNGIGGFGPGPGSDSSTDASGLGATNGSDSSSDSAGAAGSAGSDGGDGGGDGGGEANGGLVGAPNRYAANGGMMTPNGFQQAAPQASQQPGLQMPGQQAAPSAPQDPMHPALANLHVQNKLANPQVMNALKQHINAAMQSGAVNPQQLQMMGQLAQSAIQHPELWPKLRQFAIQAGIPDAQDLPMQFSQQLAMAMMAAAQALQHGDRPGAFADGGVPGGANSGVHGGMIHGPGTGISDSVPAVNTTTGQPLHVANTEYIIPADVVQTKGREFFDNLVRKYHTPAALQRQGK
jgi:hypothetical protein